MAVFGLGTAPLLILAGLGGRLMGLATAPLALCGRRLVPGSHGRGLGRPRRILSSLAATTGGGLPALHAARSGAAALMSRSVFNFLLDTVLLIAFFVFVWSAVIVRFVFPPGPDAKGWLLWGLDYDQWATIQFAMVAMLALGILLHVMLHWSWVCGILAARLSR